MNKIGGIIKTLKYSIGKRLALYRQMRVWSKYGDLTRYHFNNENIKVGEHTYGVPKVIQYDNQTRLNIGSFCSIAQDVTILLGGNHGISISTFPFYKESVHNPSFLGVNLDVYKGDVNIGNDVWIGYDALILSGVTIGDGAIIGARSVVAKDVPPYSIVVGSPARVVKYRYTEDIIETMLKIKWWEWPDEKITSYINSFNGNVEDFIAEVKQRGDL